MALDRKDIPLAETTDPGKDNIIRTKVVNPNGSITYKMNWNNSSSSSNTKPSIVNKSKSSPKVSGRISGSSGSREITTMVPMSKGLMNKEEIKSSPIKITPKGDNRTWQQKRKEEVTKRDYNQYKQEDETVSEWKERSKKDSKEVGRKASDSSSRKVFSKPASGSGGCNNC